MGPDRDLLVQMYESGSSYGEIAVEYGVSRTQVMRWMKAFAIPARTLSEARTIAARKYPNSEKQRESARKQAVEARKGITVSSYEKMVATRRRNGVNYTTGENHYMWRGGPARLSNRKRWRQRRLECYRRDSWTCQDCGCDCHATRNGESKDARRLVQAHHVVPRRHGGNDELENLVTLCLSCHQKRETRYFNALFA